MNDAQFSALFGALTTEHRMNFIANNLANVNTHGYKRDTLAFSDTMAYYAHDEIREPLMTVRSKPLFPEPKNMARSRIAVSNVDFGQGSMKVTGDPLDLAIAGENAFFKVDTPNGQFLTRNGHFVLSSDGTIMTPQGYALQGEGGPIQIPQGTRNITISGDGQVHADGVMIARIQLFSVDNLKNMEKMGHNFFKPRYNVQVTEGDGYAGGARVEQGFVEAANVEVVTEMVNMIETNRQFEAYQKVMQTADTLDRAANDRVGKRT
ncbi:MAG: flagellar hook-basal body protein [Desulfovibrio sp.]|nr:flagellar hook-basal body protein [Desulfovibrio sp.]